ncbi:DUF1097 domain-containing protein [Siccibacter turicensis]|uniref:DUF1097 domain-containing protein n=1 Tax=Siccibacter turicensis TaxID=357233 RepID=UPI0023F4391A|nr:DUF1097 domain-containing protein [Siccibacter turicensis]
MKRSLSLAFTTGLLSAIWAWVAVALTLPSWAGFLGCTAFFACPHKDRRGLLITFATLSSGVAWAQIILHLSALTTGSLAGYALTGVVAFLMCIQAQRRLLAFIPGTFIGACATFAAQGDWQSVLPALWLGMLFGAAMFVSGMRLGRRPDEKAPGDVRQTD